MRVASVGLGAMGSPMARNLARAGLLAAVWNRTPGKAERLKQALASELGAAGEAVATPATLAELALASGRPTGLDAVVLCVSADADVLACVDALGPALATHSKGRALVIDCSTVAAATARDAADRLAALGVGFLDCPVSGGTEGARDGTLAIMCGGSEPDFARAQPVLAALGKRIALMGPVGAGQATKAVNQIAVAGINQAVTEALAFARAEGLPLDRVIDTLGGGAAGSWFLGRRGPTMVRGEFPLGFKVALHQKDLGIVQAMAAARGVRLPVVEMTRIHYDRLIEQGHGDEDISALYRLKRALFGGDSTTAVAGPRSSGRRAPYTGAMAASPRHYYLPDFCAGRSVAVVMLVCQLLAFVLVAGGTTAAELPSIQLLKVSLFLHWLGLMSALVLCLARRLLERLALGALSLAAFLIVLATTTVLSLSAWHLLIWAGFAYELGSVLAFVLRNAAITAIVVAVLLRYFWVQHQWRHNVELEAEARVEALTSRIRPHFLFNSMNTIAALIRSRPDAAERAVEDLADLFRASLVDARTLVTLDDELDLARGHLRMEQLRLGERLQVEWRALDAPGSARVPRLLLQPLVENAVRHGIEPLATGGTIGISVRARDGALVIEVDNPMPRRDAPAIAPAGAGNRMALANIRQRLELVYGSKAALAAHGDDGRFSVVLRIPLEAAT